MDSTSECDQLSMLMDRTLDICKGGEGSEVVRERKMRIDAKKVFVKWSDRKGAEKGVNCHDTSRT
jgi:hypothetical protein